MLWRKILSLLNLSLFESETIFSRKIISERKNKFLWIYARQLSGHLWLDKIASLWPQLKPLDDYYCHITLLGGLSGLWSYKPGGKEWRNQWKTNLDGRNHQKREWIFLTPGGMTKRGEPTFSKKKGEGSDPGGHCAFWFSRHV